MSTVDRVRSITAFIDAVAERYAARGDKQSFAITAAFAAVSWCIEHGDDLLERSPALDLRSPLCRECSDRAGEHWRRWIEKQLGDAPTVRAATDQDLRRLMTERLRAETELAQHLHGRGVFISAPADSRLPISAGPGIAALAAWLAAIDFAGMSPGEVQAAISAALVTPEGVHCIHKISDRAWSPEQKAAWDSICTERDAATSRVLAAEERVANLEPAGRAVKRCADALGYVGEPGRRVEVLQLLIHQLADAVADACLAFARELREINTRHRREVVNLEHTIRVMAEATHEGDPAAVRMHAEHALGPAPDLSVDRVPFSVLRKAHSAAMAAGWADIDQQYRAVRRAEARGEPLPKLMMLEDYWPACIAAEVAAWRARA